MSLRSMSRLLPRNLSRSCNIATAPSLSATRHISPLLRPSRIAPFSRYAAFSTSKIARQKEGQTDQELSQKLQLELDMEKEMRDSEKLPASLSDFLDSSSFELHDKSGSEEVVLTRKFGDENIRVTFSIDDLNNMDPEADPYDEDAALGDEDGEAVPSNIPGSAQSGGANTKGAINQGQTSGGNINVAPEDRVAPADREDLADEEPEDGGPDGDNEPSFPARMNVSIEKKGKGTLQVETTANEGAITIESVNYFRDAKLAEPSSAEAQWKRSALYEGPPFGNLDEDLQVLLERYLDERGINTQLAVWVPEYIDFKEQREYLGWLSNVKDFVDA